MSEAKTPQPETPDNGWIAPLVRSIMNRPPIVETAGPLRCPTCGCDHQQFRGLGVFKPTDEGTKLLAVFPTADSITTIDLPEDVKVGTSICYVRYVCMCNGHHWADVKAHYQDHTATWCVQLVDEPVTGTATPGTAATECQKQPAVPQHVPPAQLPPQLPQLPQLPQIPQLANFVKSLVGNPLLAALTGGQMLPILILPTPVAFPVHVTEGPTQAVEPVPHVAHTGGPESAAVEMEKPVVMKSPDHADAFWLSWNKKVIGGRTEVLLPQLPVAKGPHFYVADRSVENVKARRDWVMRMALDIPKEVAKYIWGYILWHDRLILVLNVSEVDSALTNRILSGTQVSLVAHAGIRVHGVALYKKSDYIKLTK